MVWGRQAASDFEAPRLAARADPRGIFFLRARSIAGHESTRCVFRRVATRAERLMIRGVQPRAAVRDRADVIRDPRAHLDALLYAPTVLRVELPVAPLPAPGEPREPPARVGSPLRVVTARPRGRATAARPPGDQPAAACAGSRWCGWHLVPQVQAGKNAHACSKSPTRNSVQQSTSSSSIRCRSVGTSRFTAPGRNSRTLARPSASQRCSR
jgi:hypothetical protein